VAAKCPGVSLDAVQAMFKDMLRVPENANPQSLRYSQIQYFIGFIDAFADRPSQAVAAFEASLRARPGAGHAMMMAAVMATNEFHNEALHLSDLALSQLRSTTLDPRLMERIRESDIREFRATVQADRDAELAKDQAEQ
jgi:hypothetical protein